MKLLLRLYKSLIHLVHSRIFILIVDSPSSQIQFIEGIQHIKKFNTEIQDLVRIVMAVIRIPEKNTDILISWNIPNGNENRLLAFQRIVESFRILDWGLFL